MPVLVPKVIGVHAVPLNWKPLYVHVAPKRTQEELVAPA